MEPKLLRMEQVYYSAKRNQITTFIKKKKKETNYNIPIIQSGCECICNGKRKIQQWLHKEIGIVNHNFFPFAKYLTQSPNGIWYHNLTYHPILMGGQNAIRSKGQWQKVNHKLTQP